MNSRYLKLYRAYSISFNSSNVVNLFLELNSKGLYQSSGKNNLLSRVPVVDKHEITHFHVVHVVVQRRLRNVQKAWCTCKVVVLPILKPIASLLSSLLELSNIQEWGQGFNQTLSANHAGKMFDAREEQISGDMIQNIGRHDYKFRATWLWFRATWLGARWLSGDLTLNPCTAPGKCCSHWLYRSSWINRLRSWPVLLQLCSLVSMMACTFSCSTLSHSPSIWYLDNILTKTQSESINLGQYRPKLIFRTVYMYVKLFHEISKFELHVVQWGKP